MICTILAVAEDPAPAFAAQTGMGPTQAELRLADTGSTRNHGERAGEEAASQFPVELFDPKRLSSNRHSSLTNSAIALGGNK